MIDPHPQQPRPNEPAPAARPASGAFTAFLVVACLALSILVVILTRQNAEMRARLSEAIEQAGSAGLIAGERLDRLACFHGAGEPGAAEPEAPAAAPCTAFDFEDGRFATVIFVVTGACPTCQASSAFFERVAAAHGGAPVRVVAVQIDAKQPADLGPHGAGVEVVGVAGPEKTWLRRVTFVPATIVVDHLGAVRSTWLGELSARQQDDLDRMLRAAEGGWK